MRDFINHLRSNAGFNEVLNICEGFNCKAIAYAISVYLSDSRWEAFADDWNILIGLLREIYPDKDLPIDDWNSKALEFNVPLSFDFQGFASVSP